MFANISGGIIVSVMFEAAICNSTVAKDFYGLS